MTILCGDQSLLGLVQQSQPAKTSPGYISSLIGNDGFRIDVCIMLKSGRTPSSSIKIKLPKAFSLMLSAPVLSSRTFKQNSLPAELVSLSVMDAVSCASEELPNAATIGNAAKAISFKFIIDPPRLLRRNCMRDAACQVISDFLVTGFAFSHT
jgi:hypothetical protein